MRVEGDAVTVKSVTCTVTTVVCTMAPLVPVTVTTKLPTTVQLTLNVEVAAGGRVTLPGLRVAVHPLAGTMLVVKVTVPAKGPTGETVIVEVPVVVTLMLRALGLEASEKSAVSTTVKSTLAEWDRLPLVPVTVAV